jgi:hypothetical protein
VRPGKADRTRIIVPETGASSRGTGHGYAPVVVQGCGLAFLYHNLPQSSLELGGFSDQLSLEVTVREPLHRDAVGVHRETSELERGVPDQGLTLAL